MSADFLVTFDHLHSVPGFASRAGFCHAGARALAQRYHLDWIQIVRDGGIKASVLEATGDALALELVEHGRQMEALREQV